VALIAFAPFANANDMLDMEQAAQTIEALAGRSDVVIVSMHAGAEGEEALRLPFAHEYYHGEDRGDSVAFAHRLIDAGADLIIGHGPHVPRALELYRDRLIAYSLGNFCTYYGIRITGLNGLAGGVGIIGARRMDYGHVMALVGYAARSVSERLKSPAGEDGH